MNNLVLSNMFHRPARTIVTTVGVGIGILLVLLTVGLANGNLRDRARREANVGAEIMFRPSGSTTLSGSDELRLPVTVAAEIAKVEGVKAAVPIAQHSAQASDASLGIRLVDGVNYEEYAAMAGLQMMQGRVFTEGKDEIICDTAWLIQRKGKIGDKLKMYERDFEIVGAYEPGAGARIKIPLSTLQAQLGSEGKASAVLVKVKDGFKQEAVLENIHNAFPDSQLILTRELEELYMQGIPALNVFLNVVIAIAAVTSMLIILLTMYTTVTERTRQIGVLKSLGMSSLGISWTILQEALLISLFGTVFGVVGSMLIKLALSRFTTLIVQIDPVWIVSIILLGLFSGVVGALYPGFRAARLDAVEALNYE